MILKNGRQVKLIDSFRAPYNDEKYYHAIVMFNDEEKRLCKVGKTHHLQIIRNNNVIKDAK